MASEEDVPIQLEDFHISRRTGFLIDQPLVRFYYVIYKKTTLYVGHVTTHRL